MDWQPDKTKRSGKVYKIKKRITTPWVSCIPNYIFIYGIDGILKWKLINS